MQVFFPNAVEVRCDDRANAISICEKMAGKPRAKWTPYVLPVFTDGTLCYIASIHPSGDGIDVFKEVYENPADSYIYFVTTYKRGYKIDSQQVVKYAWG